MTKGEEMIVNSMNTIGYLEELGLSNREPRFEYMSDGLICFMFDNGEDTHRFEVRELSNFSDGMSCMDLCLDRACHGASLEQSYFVYTHKCSDKIVKKF